MGEKEAGRKSGGGKEARETSTRREMVRRGKRGAGVVVTYVDENEIGMRGVEGRRRGRGWA